MHGVGLLRVAVIERVGSLGGDAGVGGAEDFVIGGNALFMFAAAAPACRVSMVSVGIFLGWQYLRLCWGGGRLTLTTVFAHDLIIVPPWTITLFAGAVAVPNPGSAAVNLHCRRIESACSPDRRRLFPGCNKGQNRIVNILPLNLSPPLPVPPLSPLPIASSQHHTCVFSKWKHTHAVVTDDSPFLVAVSTKAVLFPHPKCKVNVARGRHVDGKLAHHQEREEFP